MAVWALRVGYVGIAVIVAGLVLMVAGSTRWVLAAGVVIWVVAACVTLTAVLRARRELAEPRPGLWPMRVMLIRDTLPSRSSVHP
jgi:hypothetical protein